MADLWPDPQQVLNNTKTAGINTPSTSSLWPDPVKSLGAPNNTKPKAPSPATSIPDAQSTLHTPGSIIGDVGIGLKQGASMVGDFFGQYIHPFTHPSDQEQSIEKSILPTSQNKVVNTLQAPARFLIKGATRALEPMSEGLGNQIASIQIDKETADSLANNKQIQTIGKQVQPQFGSNLQTNKATPTDYVMSVINSANVALPIAGLVTDFFNIAGNKLATRGTDIHVTPEQIGEVLKSDTPMPPEARAVLEHLKENGQGFDLNLKRPAGGLRQTVGEALGGTAERATTFKPTGDVNPQIEQPKPFAHEEAALALSQDNPNAIQPFAHEPTIQEQPLAPFAHEMAGDIGGANSLSSLKTVALNSTPDSPIFKQAVDQYIQQQGKTIGQLHSQYFNNNIGEWKPNTPESVKTDFYNHQDMVNKLLKNKDEAYQEIYNEVSKSNTSSSITLTAELVPGLSKTISEDIIPKAQGVGQRISDIYHEIASTVNPTGAAPKEALDIIMKNKGDFEKTIFRTEQKMKSIEKAWDKQPEENRLAFMEKIETGQDVGDENRELAKMYRERLNNAYTTIAQYKEGVNFLDNYFPHFWKNPGKVEKEFIPDILKRRPMEGSKSFLKQRIFQTIQEGMEAGYKPVSTNPEVLVQLYEQSVAKFKMAQQIKADLKAAGMWKVIQNGKPLPAGYDYIDDQIARAYFPQGQIETPSGTKEHFAQYGRAAAPTPVARLINNHLSPDWINNSATGKTLMQFKNSMNAIQLGFSAFHASFETILSAINGIDIAISKAVRGDIGGALKEVVKSPGNVIHYWRDGQKFYNGDPELLKIEDDLFHGGASLTRKSMYFKNTVLENFGKNVREGNMVGAIGRAPLAAIEGGTRLIMSQVPKVKIGAFRALFANELERYAKRGQLSEKQGFTEKGLPLKTKETIAREVWNNIENRFGQLNYDNLFWNRTFKAINMLTWRAVGWNLGSIREFGGAATQDLYQFAQDAIHGRMPDFTPKMRITFATLAVIGVMSAIYEYLHTGHRPKQLVDFIAPENGAVDQNGDAVRVNWPAYTKDMMSYATSPLQTVKNKAAPEVSMLFQLLSNRDYYGNYVYNPHDGFPTQLEQSLKYIANQYKPFSITNQIELSKGNATNEEKIEGYLGIQKAPSDVIQSDRTKAIYNSLPASGPKTPEEQQLSQLKNKYRKQIQQGNIPSFEELKNAGVVTNAVGYRKFIKEAGKSPAERAYQSLPKAKKSEIPK